MKLDFGSIESESEDAEFDSEGAVAYFEDAAVYLEREQWRVGRKRGVRSSQGKRNERCDEGDRAVQFIIFIIFHISYFWRGRENGGKKRGFNTLLIFIFKYIYNIYNK